MRNLGRTLPRLAAGVALTLLAITPALAQTTGLVPLIDLGAGTHGGFPGGLYPGSLNTPPAAHLDSALARASGIVPRDALGNPDPHGWIGMIAVGMSNTTHEFGAFERNADQDPSRNARVVIVDTGFGGQTATVIANPAAGYWTTMMQRLAAMGLAPSQVQVAWLKEAEAQPPNNFPLHAQALRDTLKRVVQNLHDKFPNLRICYVSSRIYGGYSAQGTLNPEPQAYESGFAVKWLIEDQIDGDAALNYGQLPGDVRAPLLLWGPYLWADGVNPRSDGLTWQLGDLESDRVHPSPAGEQKVAAMLADFFANDATCASWWPAQPDARLVAIDATDDAFVTASDPDSNAGFGPMLFGAGGATPSNIHATFDASGESGLLLLAKLSLRVFQSGGGGVRRVDDASWDEGTITWTTAPPLGPVLVSLPQSSRDGTLGAAVTNTVRDDPDGLVSFALTMPGAAQSSYWSKEGGDAPRLVLVYSTATLAARERPPARARLTAIAPNPSTHEARIAFELAAPGRAQVQIHGLDGRRVRTLAAGAWPAGRHELRWDGRDDRGARAAPGVYWVCLGIGEFRQSRRLVRLR